METKICVTCKEKRPITEFYKSGKNTCKSCHKIRRERFLLSDNPTAIKIRNRKLQTQKRKEMAKELKEITCSKCEITKPINLFKVNRQNTCGFSQLCKACAAKDAKSWRASNYERGCELNRKNNTPEKRRNRHRKLRQQILEAYGGHCVCCGETESQFLTVDHIFNDGAEHRRGEVKHNNLYRWLRRKGFPKDRFQLLCYNCNLAKGRYGKCPHQDLKIISVWTENETPTFKNFYEGKITEVVERNKNAFYVKLENLDRLVPIDRVIA